MTPARTGALLGVATALLIAAPAAVAEPAPPGDPGADAVLDVENDVLSLDARPTPVDVPATADRVVLSWDTTAIEPGTVFGDAITLRASPVAAQPPTSPAAGDEPVAGEAPGEPVTVPVGTTGTLVVDAPVPGEHLLRVHAEAHTLDGRPLTVAHDYRLAVAEAPLPEINQPEINQPEVNRPETEVEPRWLPPTPALDVAPEPRVAAAQQPPTATGRVTLDRGHVDVVAPRLLPDGLHVQVRDGTVAGVTTWREPAEVEFRVTNAARTALPEQPELSFLGGAGKQVFLLPQTQQADLPWTGWSTEDLRPTEVAGPVTWTLTAVAGPGAFGLFTTGSFGKPAVIFNSADGLPDTHSVALGTHAHANWAFAEPGRYRLTFTVTAPAAAGGTLTDTETYTFSVGDGAGALPPQPQGGDPTTDQRAASGTDQRTGTPNRLASTGPAALHATAGLALALIVTGAAVLVRTRRRPAEENR